LHLLIVEQVLAGVGFFSLLSSAYVLVLEWEPLSNDSLGTSGMSILNRITGNRRLFHAVLSVAVVLGIVGATQISSSDLEKGSIFRVISTAIFLALTVLLVFRSIRLFILESKSSQGHSEKGWKEPEPEWEGYIFIVLCSISCLLLVREAFATATLGDCKQYHNEHLWYPLTVVPEIIAVMLFATPDLFPPRFELPRQTDCRGHGILADCSAGENMDITSYSTVP